MSKDQKRTNKEKRKPKNDASQVKKPTGPKYLREPTTVVISDLQAKRPRKK